MVNNQLYSDLLTSCSNNVLLTLISNNAEQNIEPSPTFDIEINKEDKDKDVENPVIRKEPNTEKQEDKESPLPENNN